MRRALLYCAAIAFAIACGDSITEPIPDRTQVTQLTPPVAFATTSTDDGLSITTDRDDYAPGDTVHFTGTGWQPGDSLDIVLVDNPMTHESHTWAVGVGEDGTFHDSTYVVDTGDLGVTFTLTATSRATGRSLTVVFTDGNIRVQSNLAGISFTVTATKYIGSSNCTTGPQTPTTPTITNSPTTFTAVPGESYKFEAAATSDQGGAFVNWTTADPVVSNVGNTLCVTGFNGNRTYTANYVAKPDLKISKTHSGSFTDGTNGTYTLRVTNVGAASSSGTVEVTDALPAELTFVSWSGTGWTCGATCTRSDALGANTSYPDISLVVTPTAAAVPSVSNTASVSGGGDLSPANNTATDPTAVNGIVNLSIDKSHTGDFTRETSEQYSFLVSNTGSAATSAAVMVIDTLPAGLTFVSGTGTGWTACTATGQVVSCTRPAASPIGAGTSAPAIALTVSVGAATASSITNRAHVRNGGEAAAQEDQNCANGDNCDSDPTTVISSNNAPDLATIGNKTVDEEIELAFTATATDENVSTLVFSLANPATGTFPTGAVISAGGAFTWTPTESQGPGVYRVKIVVTDEGSLTDEEEIQITVNEVNEPPVLSVPANFSIQWGVALSGVQATATDPDIPANTLTFSLVTPPAGMTINSSTGVISWTPSASQVGANVVTVKVDDNGSPVMSDQESFTITVLERPTALVYDGSLSGQYSDQSTLSATLTDAGVGPLNGTAISGKTVSFTFDGAAAGSDATDISGKAEVLYTIPKADGNYNVTASFTANGGYSGSSDSDNTFDVDAEDATVTADGANPTAVPVTMPGGMSIPFNLIFDVQEDTDPAPEPQVNDGAVAGNINLAGLSVTLVGIGPGGNVGPVSCSGMLMGGSDYAQFKRFTCSFSSVPVNTYEVDANVTGGYYEGGAVGVVTVFDPSLGFVTGGGTFEWPGTYELVNFGFTIKYNKKGTNPQGSLLIIRHTSTGEIYRAKSNALSGGPAISGSTATFNGKATYIEPGWATATGNNGFTAYIEDNNEAGTGSDKFWLQLKDGLGAVIANFSLPTLATANARTLTGGNIQVPHVTGP